MRRLSGRGKDMKKGFTLIEIITAMAITAILLTMVLSITLFSSKILKKNNDNIKRFDEVSLVEAYYKKFLESAKTITIDYIDSSVTNEVGSTIFFDQDNKELLIDSQMVLKTEVLESISVYKSDRLITSQFRAIYNKNYTFYYFV